tara:strand:+ start:1438 stop:3807 length:2370 start_codon:yes stop_codon:yes gene_type:complete
MIEDRPFPHEIREAWHAVIDPSDLTSDEKERLIFIVSYAQPPVSIATLTQAAALYALDVCVCDIAPAIKILEKSGMITHDIPKRIGTNFPVFYALTNHLQLNQPSSVLAHQARIFMSDFFKDVKQKQLISRSNFYYHVLAARDIIKELINADYPKNTQVIKFSKYVLKAIKSDAFYAHRRKEIEDKIKVFTMLVNGELNPGEKSQEYKGGGRGSGSKITIKTDQWHDKRLSQLANAPPPPRGLMREAHDINNTLFDTDDDLEAYAISLCPTPDKKRVEALEEASEHITLQRATPSTLTRRDDSQLTRRFTLGAPTTTLSSITDISRLTPEHIHDVISLPMNALTHTYAILLLSTGLPAKRLMKLVVSQHLDAVILDQYDERPHYCPSAGVLCYRLLDGPSVRSTAPESLWVSLNLPASLAMALGGHKSDQYSQLPFFGARGRLNKQLRRHFRKKPGISPTANRLSASSWLYRRPHAVDDVAAATLAGQFGLALAAPAAYRQLPVNEIQQLFNDTLKNLGVTDSTSSPVSDQNFVRMPIPNSQVGSAVAQSSDAFVPIFQEIRAAMRAPQSEISRWWLGMPFPIDALVTLYQLVATHELLAWQLSSGARPVGANSENNIGEKRQWIHDKNSARGTESRVIPVLAPIRDGLRALQRWISSLIHITAAEGIIVVDRRTAKRDTPAWLLTQKQGQRLVLRDMNWSDISSLRLPYLAEWPNNVARHSLTSWLRHHIQDAAVDALLGHARHGRMLSSPRAEASIGEQPQLRRALQMWLSKCGYQPLNWSHMPWHY